MTKPSKVPDLETQPKPDRLSKDDLNAVNGGSRETFSDKLSDKVVSGAGTVLSGAGVVGGR